MKIMMRIIIIIKKKKNINMFQIKFCQKIKKQKKNFKEINSNKVIKKIIQIKFKIFIKNKFQNN